MVASERAQDIPNPSDIVLIHGDFGDGEESWRPTCELIGRRYRSVVVDRPGFGQSLGTDDQFSVAGEARYILESVDTLAASPVHLVGHSYGALVALEMAISSPDSVRSLHLIEPPLLSLLPEEPSVREMDQRVREIVNQHAASGAEATTKAFFTMIGADRAIARLQGTPEWDRLCAHADRFSRGQAAGDYPAQAVDLLAETIPVTLYTGGRSHSALRQIVYRLADQIERAHLVDFPDASHAVQMSGAAFVDTLLARAREADLLLDDRSSIASGEPAREQRSLGRGLRQ